jgi:hypothetical protein
LVDHRQADDLARRQKQFGRCAPAGERSGTEELPGEIHGHYDWFFSLVVIAYGTPDEQVG